MLDARRACIERCKVGDVGGDRQCTPSQPLQFGGGVPEARLTRISHSPG
jgi:hypothetical protein